MKRTMIAGAVIAALTLATAVEAKDGNYYGLSVSQLTYDESGISADVMTIDGKIGTYFSENFSGEIRLGLGVADDTVNVFGTDVDVDIPNYYGAYVRGGIPVTDGFYPYIVAGYTRGKVEASAMGTTVSETESDVSYGLGADFSVSKDFDITLEYMNYLDKDGVEVDGISLGFKARF